MVSSDCKTCPTSSVPASLITLSYLPEAIDVNVEIEWAGERLVLLPDKAVAWPRTSSLIVADLHLGKPAAFRSVGIPVPEFTTTSDLDRLDRLILEHRSERLIILGDFFHSVAGLQTEMMGAVADWCRKNDRLKILLVPGNHDKKCGSPPACWNIHNVCDGWTLDPFSFCHEPREITGKHVMAGHIHPSIVLSDNVGGSLRLPCFWFTPTYAVLPAFGSFTGTQSIRPAPVDRLFVLGPDEIAEVSK